MKTSIFLLLSRAVFTSLIAMAISTAFTSWPALAAEPGDTVTPEMDPLSASDKNPARSEKALVRTTESGEITEFTLEPVITEGTAIEALKYDAILPAQKESFSHTGSTGAITKELQNTLPFHFAENAKPGSASTISGSVRGAEEIDVNVLGVPLNFPQGGGFYLQSFPQYLWSGYTFQFGPAMGAFDPRGVAGSLGLRLWSSEALNSEKSVMDAGALHSTQDLQQFYAGAAVANRFSLRAGYGTGVVKGPAGSLSTRILDNDSIAVKFHALASKQEVEGFQSERSLTASADYTTLRAIPVLQVDVKLGRGWLLKNSVFYDNSYLKTEDPTNLMPGAVLRERAHVYQGGFESALVGKDLRVGFGARQTDYHRLRFAAPTEKLLNVQASYSLHPSEDFTLEPTIGGTAVTRIGFYPMATLGARYEMKGTGLGLFSRVGLHHRFPSLLDRYYSVNAGGPRLFVAPNPELNPERVYSAEVGADHRDDVHSASLILFARYSKNARYYVTPVGAPPFVTRSGQIVNNGDAYTFGVWQTYDREIFPFLSAGTRASFSRARYRTAKVPYTYQPELVGILLVDVHTPDRFVSLQIADRASSSYYGGSEATTQLVRLPGYNYLDLTLTVHPTESLSLMASVENVFDRQIEFRADQRADVGRYIVLSANAQF